MYAQGKANLGKLIELGYKAFEGEVVNIQDRLFVERNGKLEGMCALGAAVAGALVLHGVSADDVRSAIGYAEQWRRYGYSEFYVDRHHACTAVAIPFLAETDEDWARITGAMHSNDEGSLSSAIKIGSQVRITYSIEDIASTVGVNIDLVSPTPVNSVWNIGDDDDLDVGDEDEEYFDDEDEGYFDDDDEDEYYDDDPLPMTEEDWEHLITVVVPPEELLEAELA